MAQRLIGFLLLALAAGCGRGIDDGKKVNAAIAPEVAPAVKVDAPDPRPVFKVTPTIYSARELAKILDLTKLPEIKGTEISGQTFASFRGNVPVPIPDAAQFYAKSLEALGWSKFDPADSRPLNDDYGSFYFTKNGHYVNVDVSDITTKSKEPLTRVNIVYFGNFDSRTLPKPLNAGHSFASPWLSAYDSTAPVAVEAAAVVKSLKGLGWQEFTGMDSDRDESKDHVALSFRKQGYALAVVINTGANQNAKTAVTFSVRVLAHELPAPADARHVEFDDDAWMLRCETPRNVKAAVDYYRTAMPDLGYAELPSKTIATKSTILRFATPDHDEIEVRIEDGGTGSSKISINGVPANVVARRKALEKEFTTPEVPKFDPTEKVLWAEDIPLPKDAVEVHRNADREEISFRSAMKVAPLVNQLRDTFRLAGWKDDAANSLVSETSAFVPFKQDSATLRVVVIPTGASRQTQVIINTRGLRWKNAGS